MVVAGPVGALDAGMAVQVEVKLCRVADVPVNQRACTTQEVGQGPMCTFLQEQAEAGKDATRLFGTYTKRQLKGLITVIRCRQTATGR